MVRVGRVNEAGRLLAIDCLLQVAVKESILHVELVNWPGAGGGDAEDDSNHCQFYNRAERLAMLLG
jgi:hypothetical protein